MRVKSMNSKRLFRSPSTIYHRHPSMGSISVHSPWTIQHLAHEQCSVRHIRSNVHYHQHAQGPLLRMAQVRETFTKVLMNTIKRFSDHTIVPLKIYFSLTESVIFEEPFTFYDCAAQQLYVTFTLFNSHSILRRCTACVRSRWPCHWCLLDNRCVHTAQHCTNQVAAAASTVCPYAPFAFCLVVWQCCSFRIPSVAFGRFTVTLKELLPIADVNNCRHALSAH